MAARVTVWPAYLVCQMKIDLVSRVAASHAWLPLLINFRTLHTTQTQDSCRRLQLPSVLPPIRHVASSSSSSCSPPCCPTCPTYQCAPLTAHRTPHARHFVHNYSPPPPPPPVSKGPRNQSSQTPTSIFWVGRRSICNPNEICSKTREEGEEEEEEA